MANVGLYLESVETSAEYEFYNKYTLTHTYAGHLKLSHCVAAYEIVECILFISWQDLLATSWWPFKIQTNQIPSIAWRKRAEMHQC